MASSIDETKPTEGTALTSDVRANFAAAKSEIEALQTDKASLADLASTATDDGTKGFHLVSYPPLAGEIGVVNYEYPYDDARRYGINADNADNSIFIQNAIDSWTSNSGIEMNLPAGVLKVGAQTIELKRGVVLVGAGQGWDSGCETVLKMADNSDKDMFNTQVITFTQFVSIRNCALDGNKANQGAGTFHGLNLYWFDIANTIGYLKISDFSGHGVKYVNTGTQTGNTEAHHLIINRCDAGAVGVYGPVQNLTFYHSAFEGNGGATGSNIVLDALNDTSIVNLVECRGECRATASGGAARHVQMNNCNGATLNIIAGNYSTGNNYSEHIQINTSTARVNVSGLAWPTDSVDIIDDNVRGQNLTYAVLGSKVRNFSWNADDILIADVTGANPILQRVLDTSGNMTTRTASNATPEGVVSANVGSLHYRSSAGTAACVYQKKSGTGTTGWLPLGVDAAITTISDGDTTPSVAGVSDLKTANTAGTTITYFDGGIAGQEIWVLFNDANTTVDFTGTNLYGNGGIDFVAAQYDTMRCKFDGARWYCAVSNNTA